MPVLRGIRVLLLVRGVCDAGVSWNCSGSSNPFAHVIKKKGGGSYRLSHCLVCAAILMMGRCIPWCLSAVRTDETEHPISRAIS